MPITPQGQPLLGGGALRVALPRGPGEQRGSGGGTYQASAG